MAVYLERVWDRVLYHVHRLLELILLFRCLQRDNSRRRRACLLRDLDDLVENPVLLVLNNTAIVSERTDSESLGLTSPALEERVFRVINQSPQLPRARGTKWWDFTILQRHTAGSPGRCSG